MINIIYEDNHVLVVEKPINVLVQEDYTKDKDMLTILKEYLKDKYNKPGNVYLGLVHRLDRPVGGVMVFAKTSKAASRLSEEIRNHLFHKTYHAVIKGELVKKNGIFIDKLLKNSKTNKVVVSLEGKESKLEYEVLDYNKESDMSLVKINLLTGRSHQIRVQFSNHNHPLVGDQKYNIGVNQKIPIALFASSINFTHPTTKEEMKFSLDLPIRYPWNIFK